MSLTDVAEIEGLPADVDINDLYEKYRLAKMTGWTLEYIEDLGLLNREGFVQIDEGIAALNRPRRSKGKSTWP
jgi:hypothetical protein